MPKFESYKRWTDREIAILKHWAPIGGHAACCRHLKKRSAVAVYAKMWQLKLIEQFRGSTFG